MSTPRLRSRWWWTMAIACLVAAVIIGVHALVRSDEDLAVLAFVCVVGSLGPGFAATCIDDENRRRAQRRCEW